MKIFDRFEIVDCCPALYMPRDKILIVSDIHLGLEDRSSREDYYTSKSRFEEAENSLNNILNEVDVREVIINGDLRHMFSRSNDFGRKKISKILNLLEERINKITINRGNHDNNLTNILRDRDISLKNYVVRENVLITHGHRKFDVKENFEYIIIGHDHPVLSLRDEVGIEEEMQCFIYGKCGNKKIVMLPAFSKLSEACKVNRIKYNEDRVFSPFLRNCDVNEFGAIGIDRENDLCLNFPKIADID